MEKGNSKAVHIFSLVFSYLVLAFLSIAFWYLNQPVNVDEVVEVEGEITDVESGENDYYITIQSKEYTIIGIMYDKYDLDNIVKVGDFVNIKVSDEVILFIKQSDVVSLTVNGETIYELSDFTSVVNQSRKTRLIIGYLFLIGWLGFTIYRTIKLVKNNFYKKERIDYSFSKKLFKKYKFLEKNKDSLDQLSREINEIFRRNNPYEFESEDLDDIDSYFYEIARVLVYLDDVKKSGFKLREEEEVRLFKYIVGEQSAEEINKYDVEIFRQTVKEILDIHYHINTK